MYLSTGALIWPLTGALLRLAPGYSPNFPGWLESQRFRWSPTWFRPAARKRKNAGQPKPPAPPANDVPVAPASDSSSTIGTHGLAGMLFVARHTLFVFVFWHPPNKRYRCAAGAQGKAPSRNNLGEKVITDSYPISPPLRQINELPSVAPQSFTNCLCRGLSSCPSAWKITAPLPLLACAKSRPAFQRRRAWLLLLLHEAATPDSASLYERSVLAGPRKAYSSFSSIACLHDQCIHSACQTRAPVGASWNPDSGGAPITKPPISHLAALHNAIYARNICGPANQSPRAQTISIKVWGVRRPQLFLRARTWQWPSCTPPPVPLPSAGFRWAWPADLGGTHAFAITNAASRQISLQTSG